MSQSNQYRLIAPFYDLFARIAFGKEFFRIQAEPINSLKGKKAQVLIPAIGTGRLIKHIESGSQLRIFGLDSSSEMLSSCRKMIDRSEKGSSIELIQEDVFAYEPKEPFDLILANFFLDCLPDRQIPEFINKAKSWTKPGGRLVINEFYLNESSSLLNKILIKLAYLTFKILTNIPRSELPRVTDFVDEKEWRIERITDWKKGFIKTYSLEVK